MLHMTPLTRWLRIFTGIALVLSVLYAGYVRQSPRVVLWLAIAFTVSYICGRFAAWVLVYRQGKLVAALRGVPLTYIVQLLLVSVLYLLGLGASTLLNDTGVPRATGPLEALYPLFVGGFGIAMGLLISWLEARNSGDLSKLDALENQSDVSPPRAELMLLPDPVSVPSFFNGAHYSHIEPGENAGESNRRPNAKSAGSLEKIAEAQSRLGIQLPARLVEIYLHQNGGSINAICVPKPGIAQPRLYEDVITPFSGYNDLYPLEIVNSLHEAITNYADPESQPEAFPEGCERMFVLARWYSETLFLDYRQSGEPRVGFVNFEDLFNWQDRCQWWSNFDAFFAQCRHYKDL